MEHTTNANASEFARIPSVSLDLDLVNPDLIKVLRAEEILAQMPSLGGFDDEYLRREPALPAVPARPEASESAH